MNWCCRKCGGTRQDPKDPAKGCPLCNTIPKPKNGGHKRSTDNQAGHPRAMSAPRPHPEAA